MPSGHRLHYVDIGQGDPVVCLHGNPTWSYYFRNCVQTLKNHSRVIVPDHMGCGYSDKPQEYPYILSQHIANLEYLCDYLRLDKVTLIVHDWGGAIGFGWAVQHMKRIKK